MDVLVVLTLLHDLYSRYDIPRQKMWWNQELINMFSMHDFLQRWKCTLHGIVPYEIIPLLDMFLRASDGELNKSAQYLGGTHLLSS